MYGYGYKYTASGSIGSNVNQPATIGTPVIDSITDTGFVISCLVTPGSSPVTPSLHFGLTTAYSGTPVDATEGEISEATTCHFTVTGATAFKTYYFKVMADEVESSAGSVFTADFADVTVLGKNKFNPATAVSGNGVNSAGAFQNFANSVRSDYIAVTDDDGMVVISGLVAYTSLSGEGYAMFTDAANTRVGSVLSMPQANTVTKFIIPKGAKKFVFDAYYRKSSGETIDLNAIQVEFWEQTTFEAYSATVVNQQVDDSNLPIFVATPGKNKFSKHKYLPGYEVSSVNGNITPYSTSASTAYIEIPSDSLFMSLSGFTAYTGSNRNVGFFTENKTFIIALSLLTSATSQSYAVPASAKYALVELVKRKTGAEVINYDTIQIEFYGETAYEAYSETLQNRLLAPSSNLVSFRKSMICFGDSKTETSLDWSLNGATYTEGGRQNWPTHAHGYLRLHRTNFRNYAASGAIITDNAELEELELSGQVATAIAHAGFTPDIIVINMGTNSRGDPLGDFATAMAKATLGDLDRSKKYEALRWAMWTIRNTWPDALCFAANVMQRPDYPPPAYDATNLAIQLMAAEYDFIYVDQETESGVVAANEAVGANGQYLVDGLHENHAGWVHIGNFWKTKILAALAA